MLSRDRTFDAFLDIHQSQSGGSGGSVAIFQKLRDRRKTRIAREQASDAAWQEYTRDRDYGAFDGSFLEWLIDHADQIFALLAKFLALLGL